MNSKIKTIKGILLLSILVAGAYFAYNALSRANQPDIAFPDYYNNAGTPENGAPGTTSNNITDAAQNNGTADQSNNRNQASNPSEGNDVSPSPEETGEVENQKFKAFDFTVYNAEGEQVKLSDFFGKPIIINFWATWCPYCVEEMPLFEEYFNQYKDDIHFLMVDSVDGQRETLEKGKKFIEESGYTFPVYYDLDFDASTTYQTYSLPTSIFIDKDGHLIAYHPGMLTEELLQKGIDLIIE